MIKNVKKFKRGVIASSLSVLVVSSMFTPAFAGPEDPEYKLNFSTTLASELIAGAEYEVEQTESGYDVDAGKYGDPTLTVNPFKLKVDGVVDETLPDGVQLQEPEAGRVELTLPEGSYEMRLVKAPQGYYHVNKDIKFHLPFTKEDGSGNENEITINQKFEKIAKKVVLKKLKNNTSDVLDGAKFQLWKSSNTDDPSVLTDYTHFTDFGAEFTTVNGEIEINNIPFGHYYLKEIEAPNTFVRSKQLAMFTVKEEKQNDSTDEKMIYELEFKNFSEPIVDKELKDKPNSTEDDPLVAASGSKLAYTVEVKLPEDIASYQYFFIRDIMDPGITFSELLDAEIEGVQSNEILNKMKDITDSGKKVLDNGTVSGDAAEQADREFLGWKFSKDDSSIDVLKTHGGKTLKITYEATLDKETESQPGQKFKNDIEVTFFPKDYSEADGDRELKVKDPDEPPVIKTPNNKLVIDKVDGTTNDKLDGVKFDLYKQDKEKIGQPEEWVKIKSDLTTENGGQITVEDLPNGTYKLVETATIGKNGDDPGYRLLNKPLMITFDKLEKEVNEVTKTINNYKSNVFIPNTGTLGAVGFLGIGSGIMLIGTALKKRKDEEDAE